MKKPFLLFLWVLLAVIQLNAQTTVTIGAGALTGTASNGATGDSGPMYRSTAASNFVYSRHHYLYTAAELATAGITAGSLISDLQWNLDNAAASNSPFLFQIWIKNSALTTVGAGGQNWATLISGSTQVYNNSATTATGPNWQVFSLATPFLYTGGALEISVNFDISTGTNPWTTAGFSWKRDNATNVTLSYVGSTVPPATLPNLRTVRPQIRITYGSASACTAPPTAGASTATPSSGLCSGNNIQLNLSGNSTGTGQTYQWQYGPTASGPWTNLGGSQPSTVLSTTASVSQYYQCEVTCSGNTVASTPVLVTVNPAFPSGTYTIDKTQPASATNFVSFASAIAALTCGISGPVVLDVVTGTGPYTEQVLIPSSINTSSINTVTINGNGNLLTVPANNSNLYTLGLDGADYITVNDLTIEGTDGTYALACHLWNNADNNAFNNCTFKAPLNSTVTTTSPFSCSGSATSAAATGNSGSNNVLTGCTTIGGYYSLVFYGNSGLINTGNKVLNCTAQDFYTYGIYALYQNGWEVTGSIVERPTRTTLTTCYGIYASTGCTGSIIRNNKVRNTFAQLTTSTGASYCIYVSTDGTVGNENQIYNNLVYDIKSAGIIAGIYTPSADYTVVYHNTISLDDAASTQNSTTYGIYNTGSVGGIDIRNNLVSITRGGTGTKYCLYYTGTLQNSNNNVLYLNAAGGTNNTGYNGTAYSTLLAWQTATSKDGSSVNANPLFNNPSTADFTPTASGVSNIGGSVGIATDINGQSRNLAAPDPGAIEFILSSLDVSFPSISSPIAATGCYGSNETVVAEIKNSGNDPLDFSLNPVTVTVNISGPSSYTISETINFGTLGVNQTQSVNLIPSVDLTVDGTYTVTGNVSVAGDGNPSNDNLTPFNLVVGITPGTITSSLSSPVCYSQNPTFTLTGQFGGTRQWQISTVSATGPWTNVGTGGTTYVATGQTQDYWIQVESNCNFNYAYSNVMAIVVNNPALLSTTPGSRCGIGTVDLSATANGSATINWYADATGGLPLATGTNFTTPVISSTTTYYAAATDGGATLNTGLPNRVGATTNSGYSDVGLMFDALQPFTLNSVAIYPVATTPSGNVTATIALKNSAGTILQSTTISVPTSTSPGIKTLVPLGFNVPMGTGHRLVFTSASGGGISGFIRELTSGFTYPYTIPGVSSITSAYTGGASSAYYYYFYDWSVSYGCEGSRSPVVATINTAPTITVSALSTTLCPGESTDISVSSSNDPNYDYSWTSTPAGFTATGAGPHTVTPNAVVTYTVTATDNTAGPYSGCVSVGTVTITSAATLSGGTISADLSEHCFTGSSILTSSGTSGGPIQWEESTVSSSGPWTPVGTSATTYTTPTLTQTTYYRVGVTCGANTDYSAVKTITVNDPTVSATAPGETCGSGTVTLGATPNNAAYNIRWYAAASGGNPLATGLTFTTPVLASTTTYYAAPVANSGGSGTNVAIPLASGGTTGVYHHMFLVSATNSVYVSSIGIKCNNTVGTLTAWDIYYRPDNYQTVSGANTNSAGWTLLSSVTGVPSVGATNYTTISVPLNLAIPSGATYSFYVAPGAGATHQYATSAIGTTVASNSDLALKAGNRGSGLFNCATSGGMACVKFNYSTGCEGVRVPVVATVGPVVSISGLGASYYTTDAPVTLSGTPSGGSFSGPGITGSDFDPSAAGVGTHTITYSVPGTTCTATQTVTVNPPPISTLNLKFMLQGFYLGSGAMQPVLNNQGMANPTTDCDDVTVELHDASSPYGLAYSFTGVVKTDGTVTCTFPSAVIGNSYYLVVLQRNHIQTWSASPITMAVNNSYDFSTAANKAYGDNQWEVETGVFGFYAGDVNQDLTVDGFDYIDMDPNIVAGDCGYYATDLTGDGCVDVFDFLMASPNIDAGITIQAP